MLALSFVILLCSLLFSDAAFVDTLAKCSIKDEKCTISEFERVLSTYGPTGIPELNIDPIDPMKFENITVTVMEAVSLTVIEGSIKGFKNCKFKRFSLNLDKEYASEDIVCDVLKIYGEIIFGGSNPLLQSIFGTTSIKGHGKIKIKFEKVSMTLNFPVHVIKKEDGNTYINLEDIKAKYTYDIEKAAFNVKNLIIGENDISELASTFLSSNWKALVKSYGNVFVDKALEHLFVFGKKIYKNVPIKVFALEDLTPYVKN